MAALRLDEQALFEAARQLDAREAREAYVRQACGDDAALGQRVRALLRAYEASASFLETWIDEAEQRVWYLFEACRQAGAPLS